MGWINVFAAVSIQGVVTVWSKGRSYPTKEEARSHSGVRPDAGFVYLGTIPDGKPVAVTLLCEEPQL